MAVSQNSGVPSDVAVDGRSHAPPLPGSWDSAPNQRAMSFPSETAVREVLSCIRPVALQNPYN